MNNCPICKTELIERNGKFGPFICCPKGNHGTFSIQGSTLYFTGAVGSMLKQGRMQQAYDTLALQYIDTGVSFQPTLSQMMNAQLAQFGWDSSNELNQLAEFAVGDPDHMWDEDELNNSGAWWNTRMY